MRATSLAVIFILPLMFAGCATRGARSSASLSVDGDCLYRWPAQPGLHSGDHANVEIEMRLYAEKVGNCLNGPSSGLSEATYRELQYQRSQRYRRLEGASGPQATPDRYCASVRQLFLMTPYSLPGRSPDDCPQQFAACGEGARVGACLALHFGFPADKILLCNNIKSTANPESQHEFALIPDSENRNYCLLDRFARIDHYLCDVQFLESRQSIAINNQISNDPWFSGVRCETLTRHIQRARPSFF